MYIPRIIQPAQLGDPILRMRAKNLQIPTAGQSVREIAADMLATCRESGGVGIAAPQIRHSIRMIVVWPRPTPNYPKIRESEPIVMLNPGIIRHSEDKTVDWEGCLSIPGIRALVPRWTSVFVHWDGYEGESSRYSAELGAFTARIFQHELDHLNGRMFIDRVKPRGLVMESEFRKRIAAK